MKMLKFGFQKHSYPSFFEQPEEPKEIIAWWLTPRWSFGYYIIECKEIKEGLWL